IGGVSYGVVGVLEAQTAAVVAVPRDPSTISIAPANLGLLTVSTLYIATHSSFVPDVLNDVTLATLTVSYTSGGSPTTVDLVTGTTTAEWSFDRPEHTTAIGGVPHSQPSILYQFETAADSTSAYTGSVYSVVLPVDAGRTISSISLTMADPAPYAGSRLVTGELVEWAGQSVTAITLVGQPLVVVDEPELGACCETTGVCSMLESIDCLARFGTPLGDGVACDGLTCPTESDGELVACCMGAVMTLSREYVQICIPDTREGCLAGYGVPQPAGVPCDDSNCHEPLLACCEPSSDACWDVLFEVCIDKGWEPKAPGVHCDDFKCPPSDLEACCFEDGQCEDTDPGTCEGNDGTPGGPGTQCAFAACLGACCEPDGCCDITGLDFCDALGGEYLGFGTECEPGPCPEAYTCYSVINHPAVSRYRTVQPACSFDSGVLLSSLPGGGSDPTEPALFVDDIARGRSFATPEEAAAACCVGLTDFVDDPDFILTARSGGTEVGLDRIILDECEETGACCVADGGCTLASQSDCAALDSSALGPVVFKGPGTNCSTAECAEPIVAGQPTAGVCPSTFVVDIGVFDPTIIDLTFDSFSAPTGPDDYSAECLYRRADG
ncbi:MAG: hypothetical protein ACE5EX_11565, partial [Phycisphaerae bacterium]